jgi:cytidylate kinase
MRGQLKSQEDETLPQVVVPSGPRRPVIAIDGPAGAGKSTLASHLARHFGFLNIETGAMYRALALKAIEGDLSFDEEGPLLALAEATQITLEPNLDSNRVWLDGMDVSQRIREADVTSAASRISIHPRVRAWMVEQQRALGAQGGVVMEGRDIGTAVFPDAEFKFFLDADVKVRAGRRFEELAARGVKITLAEVLEQLTERDHRDRSREIAPLKCAADAIVIDSTALDARRVIEEIKKRIDATPKSP